MKLVLRLHHLAGEDQLVSLTDVETAARRVYLPGEMDYAPKILGVDPARFGNDRSVIMPRQGLQVFDPLVYRGLDNMDLAGRVADKISSWQPDAVFIDAGAGSGVIVSIHSRQLCREIPDGSYPPPNLWYKFQSTPGSYAGRYARRTHGAV